MNAILQFLRLIGQSKISILGAAITTSGFIADVILILGETLFFPSNPYIGIVVYVLFPGMIATGLLMIPLGIWWTARRRGARSVGEGVAALKVISVKSVLQIVALLTLLNLVLFGLVGYRSMGYMHSKTFCGQICHVPMHAEYNLTKISPHAEIDCVECHVGEGIDYFIKSKLDGTRQLVGVITGDYSRPIPTPVHSLRPARDVCEVCHSPKKFLPNRIKVLQTFESDEQNTRNFTVLNLRLGGNVPDGPAESLRGIHWHGVETHKVRYLATDHRRENIVSVELIDEEGTTQVWNRVGTEAALETDGEHEAGGEEQPVWREMDCIDCHNRPTHIYLPPAKAIDQRFANGSIDAKIPWIRKLSEELLTREYSTEEEAAAEFATLPELYAERYPEHFEANRDKLDGVAKTLEEVYDLYVHPEMNIRWNSYPSLIGHPTSATGACFRCHDGLMQKENGESITSDCNACHYVLADKEKNPMILRVLENQ